MRQKFQRSVQSISRPTAGLEDQRGQSTDAEFCKSIHTANHCQNEGIIAQVGAIEQDWGKRGYENIFIGFT